MTNRYQSALLTVIFSLLCIVTATSQDVPITSFTLNTLGQPQIEIDGDADKYYIVRTTHGPDYTYETTTSLTLGTDGPMVITEPLAAFAAEHYRVTAHDIANPADTDGDGVDDITEHNDMPTYGPFNYARVIPFIDGSASIPSREVYTELAEVSENIPWAPFLNDQEFVKFAIVNQSSDEPEVYFINSKTHYIHADFLETINVDQFGDDVTTGEVVYNPNIVMPNGVVGRYTFNYSFGSASTFENTRQTYELLAASMPFLQNNLQHFISSNSEQTFNDLHREDYEGSRITVVLESEVFAEVDFIPLNKAEGYGFFRKMDLDETPGSRDVVLYDALPNSLPRVGGIITSVIQTPLSHVNLRAIQDNVPNAYIRDPLAVDSIANLVGKYIYYTVDDDRYHMREATLDEVNDWFEKLRPTEPQIPQRDLSQTEILPLDEITFEMSSIFGAKCTNVATMRKFGFPEGTIPNGFGVPFYFYDEFMKYNDFYDRIDEMIVDPEFVNDLETRIDMLKDFRDDIKDADMPQWMLDALEEMHDSFPEGQSIRCRSSTNNEDLPGFSGAGLYTSKTQHPDEGHIKKSIKQVYASMWNFRAFEERDFSRVDHKIAAMGVLCHPNFKDEKSNGVGVTLDPIYNTDSTFYINTQVGEALITNPEANEIPEEILLHQNANRGYSVLRNSNLVPIGELVMDDEYLNQLREYMQVIHDEFAILYNVVGAEGFGMDIEYKVTVDNQLAIKQARPWVSFWADIRANNDLAIAAVTEPVSSSSLGADERVKAVVANRGLVEVSDFEIILSIDDEVVETLAVSEAIGPQSDAEFQFEVPQDFSTIGTYDVQVVVTHPEDGYRNNDSLRTAIRKLHELEGILTVSKAESLCGQEVEVSVEVTNDGDASISSVTLQLVVNGLSMPAITRSVFIPYGESQVVKVLVTDNLMLTDNEISVTMLEVNGATDAVMDNNTDVANVDLDSGFDVVTVVINADDFPQETGWILKNESTNEIVASGELDFGSDGISEEYCVDYNDCFSLYLSDSASDGICCAWGIGNFLVLDANGEEIFTNDGEFGSEVTEIFCPGEIGCAIGASISSTPTSTITSNDGEITISGTGGFDPYEYSINGGLTFSEEPTFSNLMYGTYEVEVRDQSVNCSYSTTFELGVVTSVTSLTEGMLAVYPNPTTGDVTIGIDKSVELSGGILVQVYNQLGQLVQSQQFSSSTVQGQLQVSMATLPAGSYMVTCSTESVHGQVKVVKL